jgi:hypothetical protein
VIKRATDDAFLGDGYTSGEDGSFSKTIENPGSSAGFRIYWYTYTKWVGGEEMRVVKSEAAGLTGLTDVYAWYAGPYYSGDGTLDIGTRMPLQTDANARACWILNDLNRANLYFSGYAGGLASQGTVAWWPTNPLSGAHYHPGGQIHLGGTMEYASHIIIHEYGHNIMYTRYNNYMPPSGCPTHVIQNCYNEGCGWVEGWPDFFCCVPDNDPIYKDPGFSIDFEGATPGNGWCEGPLCEARVCGALWDMFDTANDGLDTYSWGFGPIANVFIGGTQNTFANFWTQWQSKGYSTDASYCLLQNTIDPGINHPPNTPPKPSGPTTGTPGTSYSYSASATDPDGDQVKYTFDWGDATTSVTGLVNSGTAASTSHSWSTGGNYYVNAMATDSKGATSGWSSGLAVTIANRAPTTPSKPSGPTTGTPGTSYSYSTSATDPDGNQVKYTFDWGDGTTSVTSLVNSGTTESASHSWSAAGTYTAKAMATDSIGATSGWSSATIVTISTPNTPWSPLGGYVTSSPSVVVDNAGKTEAWVRGGDNALWVNIDGTWRGKGGVLSSDPFAVKDYNGKIHVLVRGGDNSVWDFIYDPTTATGHWKGLGGYITESPTAAQDPMNLGVMRIAAKGGDNALWTCDLNINTETHAWTPVGGGLTSRPYIMFDGSNIEHIFVRGGDNQLWDSKGSWTGSTWSHTWNPLGGYLANGPIATIEPGYSSYATVFAKGSDNALWMCDVYSGSNPETSTWYGFGGVISSDPFAVADTSANKIHVFARGGDSALWENIFSTTPRNPSGNIVLH